MPAGLTFELSSIDPEISGASEEEADHNCPKKRHAKFLDEANASALKGVGGHAGTTMLLAL